MIAYKGTEFELALARDMRMEYYDRLQYGNKEGKFLKDWEIEDVNYIRQI